MTVALACLAILLLIWVGYPVIVQALAWAVSRPLGGPSGDLPRVTFVLATRAGSEAYLSRVRNAFDTDYPGELLDAVVGLDDGSTDRSGTSERLTVVRGDDPGGKATALNAAVRAARGEILVFSDVAQVFVRSTIPRLVDELRREPALGAVSGLLEVGRGGSGGLMTMYWKWERRLRRNEARLHSTVGVTGAVYAMRRNCWRPLPAGLILDDVYGPMRVVLDGARVGFRADAIATDDRTFDVHQEFSRKVRTLTGVIQLCAWLPATLNPLRNPVWLQFLFHKLLRLATPYLVLVTVVAWVIALVARVPRESAVTLGALLPVAALLLLASRKLRNTLRMGLAMQLAVVRATVNGVRGNWDVWTR
ncbi:MAG: glycosyltransferase [Gemmatimonadota bacterium]